MRSLWSTVSVILSKSVRKLMMPLLLMHTLITQVTVFSAPGILPELLQMDVLVVPALWLSVQI